MKAYGLDFVPENLTLKNFAFVFHNRGVISAIHTSLTLAVVTTLVCIVAGTAIAYGKLRKKPGGSFTGKMCFSDVCYSRHCSCFVYDFSLG